MKLTEQLIHLTVKYPEIAGTLLSAADTLEGIKLWREAWVKKENECEELTKQLAVLRSQVPQQKGERF